LFDPPKERSRLKSSLTAAMTVVMFFHEGMTDFLQLADHAKKCFEVEGARARVAFHPKTKEGAGRRVAALTGGEPFCKSRLEILVNHRYGEQEDVRWCKPRGVS
jgi:hypothetical protein